MGGQLDIRPPNLKIGGDVSPHPPQDWRPWLIDSGKNGLGLTSESVYLLKDLGKKYEKKRIH